MPCRAEEEKKQQEINADDTRETSTVEVDAVPDPGADTSAVTVQAQVAGPEDVTMQIETQALQEATEETPAQLEMEPLDTPDDGDTSRSMSLPDELELAPIDEGVLDAAGVGLDDTDTYEQVADSTGATTRGGTRTASDQTSTLPSTRAVQTDLEAYFDHSQSMEIPQDDHDITSDNTLEEVASHTVVGAQTIFAAGERPRSRRIFVAAACIAVLIVVGIGVLGLFYAQQTPEPRYMPSPSVADGVEREVARELPVVPLEPRIAGVATGLARIDTQTAPAVAGIDESVDSPFIEDRSDAAPLTAQVAIEATVEDTATPTETTAPTGQTDSPSAPASFASAPLPPKIEHMPATTAPTVGVSAGELRISRSHKPAGVDETIRLPYDAFISDDLVAAEAAYGQALASNPDRRDALLGMGAIAVRKGDRAHAYRNYANVLKRFPEDPIASAALFSLTGSRGEATAARLRMLLDTHADQPFIHFALGNWYARRGRWGDAQLAYFDAVRFKGDNPDYAFNLAVSLDRMGQSAAVLDYYQKSLSLADSNGGNFNPANVLQRISKLSDANAP